MKTQSQKGFTLVELSIVLVIIGLLIGGILVAQSMIKTTKVQAMVRQLGQFDAAVGNFIDKFKGLPGDVTAFGGDGDSLIEDGAATAGASVIHAGVYSGEIGRFWNDLSVSGLATEAGGTDTYDSASAGTAVLDISGTDANAPAGKAGGNGSTFVAFGSATNTNWYQILNIGATATSGSGTITNTAADTLTPADALAIDSKIDDGSASAGNVIGAAFATNLGASTIGSTCTTAAGGSTYAVAGTSNTCQLKVRIGSQIGYLQ